MNAGRTGASTVVAEFVRVAIGHMVSKRLNALPFRAVKDWINVIMIAIA
jgi:hypothetical protein